MKKLESDAQELAKVVVELWQQGKSQEARKLCDEKITELLTIYSVATVAKNCQRIYRKAIIELSGVTQYTQEPISLFQVPISILTAVNESSRDTVEAQRDELIPISYEIKDKLLNTAVNLLSQEATKGQHYYEKAVGIMILTGRRAYSEVLGNALFSAVDDCYLSFLGQAKGGDEKREQPILIPALGTNAKNIEKAHQELIDYLSTKDWWVNRENGDIEKIVCNATKKQVQQAIDKHIDPIFNPVRKITPVKSLSSHDLRKIYATIAHDIYGKRQAFTAYAAGILGHSTTNKVSGVTRRNTHTSESYEKFVIVPELVD